VAAFVEPDFANTSLAFLDEAAMTTGETFQCVAGEMLGQFRGALCSEPVKNLG
jgi:hypothetical protein